MSLLTLAQHLTPLCVTRVTLSCAPGPKSVPNYLNGSQGFSNKKHVDRGTSKRTSFIVTMFKPTKLEMLSNFFLFFVVLRPSKWKFWVLLLRLIFFWFYTTEREYKVDKVIYYRERNFKNDFELWYFELYCTLLVLSKSFQLEFSFSKKSYQGQIWFVKI